MYEKKVDKYFREWGMWCWEFVLGWALLSKLLMQRRWNQFNIWCAIHKIRLKYWVRNIQIFLTHGPSCQMVEFEDGFRMEVLP